LLAGPGTTLSPGLSVGALTVTNAVVLQGTTFMELNKAAGTNDVLSGAASITYGGTLSLTNLAGTLAAGDSFKLFYAKNYGGSFSNLTPIIPALNLGWNTNMLASDGALRIVSAPTPRPRIVSCALGGSSVLMNGTNGVPGWRYIVLMQTNLALPPSAWTPVATNYFDAAGNFSCATPIDPQLPVCFYLLEEM
jgi:hypothetical protein